MKTSGTVAAAIAAGLYSSAALAHSACSSVLVPTYSPPVVASGWQAQLVANGLKKPRSIEFDSAGALIVVESGKGLTRLNFTDNGGTCLHVNKSTTLVDDESLNHGLALSPDGKTVYASSASSVFAWSYDANSGSVGSSPRVVIANMSNNDLVTRTLLLSKRQEGYLVVSRGGPEDLAGATTLSSGVSQIRAFDLSNLTSSSDPYSFDSSGRVLGWGLRNSVGLGEHPVTGGIYSVENSIDDVTRDGVDVHQNNPGEELNFHGYLNGSAEDQGGNYGHPNCFAVWDVSEIPDNSGLAVGKQFALTENSTMTDSACAKDYVAPRLTFPAHMAPIDIKFNSTGDVAYITFHGSFDTKNPVGYRVAAVAFDAGTGAPTAPASSADALRDVMSNPDASACPGACFRPTGLAWDARGRLWMASDTTGEIYVLMRTAGSPTATATATASGTIVTSTRGAKSGARPAWGGSGRGTGWAAAAAAAVLLVAV